MKFKKIIGKKYMLNKNIRIYLNNENVYDNILPVGYSKKGVKEYYGLLDSSDRIFFDDIIKKYGEYEVIDIDTPCESLTIIELEEKKWQARNSI